MRLKFPESIPACGYSIFFLSSWPLCFALTAGLESEVIGKNFGTVWDVIKLLTLGLASKLTLDTLDKALGLLKPKEG